MRHSRMHGMLRLLVESKSTNRLTQRSWYSQTPFQHAKAKRRARLKSNRSPTLRDRLRSKTGLPRPQHKLVDEELIAERLTTRLQWARDGLSAFWKDGNATATSSSSTPTTLGAPQRYELKMDVNWWFWNILLAASPALSIAFYCEWVVFPEMKKRRDEQLRKEGINPDDVAPETSSMDLTDTLHHFMDWVKFKYLDGPAPEEEEEVAKVAESTAEAVVPATTPLHQQLEHLKRQMKELEQQMQKDDPHDGPRDKSTSNIRQRAMARQEQHQEDMQKQPTKTWLQFSPSELYESLQEQLQSLQSWNTPDMKPVSAASIAPATEPQQPITSTVPVTEPHQAVPTMTSLTSTVTHKEESSQKVVKDIPESKDQPETPTASASQSGRPWWKVW